MLVLSVMFLNLIFPFTLFKNIWAAFVLKNLKSEIYFPGSRHWSVSEGSSNQKRTN